MVVFIRPVALVGACLLCAAVPRAAAAAAEESETPFVLPSTIQVDTLLEPVIARLIEKSPTFRHQCRDIAANKNAVVAVHLVAAPRNLSTHAHATLRRYSSGLVIADVEVPAASPLPELLGHEFEHVLEFIEGVDLHQLAERRPSEAVQRKDGTFETWRAVTAGRIVRAEVSAEEVR